MKSEEVLKFAVENADFLYESGSSLYGTKTPTSDHDIRGFAIPPYEYLLNIRKFESMEIPGKDHKVYSLQRFLQLVLSGDPQTTEGLFAPSPNIIRISEYGETILSFRDHLISNVIFNRIMGYGKSEWRKAMAIRVVSKEFDRTKKEVISQLPHDKSVRLEQ